MLMEIDWKQVQRDVSITDDDTVTAGEVLGHKTIKSAAMSMEPDQVRQDTPSSSETESKAKTGTDTNLTPQIRVFYAGCRERECMQEDIKKLQKAISEENMNIAGFAPRSLAVFREIMATVGEEVVATIDTGSDILSGRN